MKTRIPLIQTSLLILLGWGCGTSDNQPIPYFGPPPVDDTVEGDVVADVAPLPDVVEPPLDVLADTHEDILDDAALEDATDTGEVPPDATEDTEEPPEDTQEPPEDTNDPDDPPFDLCDLDPPCLTEGVCQTGVKSVCTDGEWICNYQFVPGFEGSDELSCDGVDNDCDGSIDEGLIELSISGCLEDGVCEGTVFAFCYLGEWHCDYGAVPLFELDETLCDGFDNDCDGETDEVAGLSSSACNNTGVCEGIAEASCIEGEILCDYSAVEDDFEDVETRCDGLDNDCDGFTDNLSVESVTPAHCNLSDLAAGPCCLLDGICEELVQATCEDSLWVCHYDQVTGFEDGIETTCDGLDNNCNGEVDEELDPANSECLSLGVCADLAPACVDTEWICGTSDLLDFEDDETSCDGIDNDCDGSVDEDLLADPGLDTVECPTTGICGNDVVARCDEGVWVCDFSDVTGYEDPETSCDGEDNDCDGETDEDISAPSGTTVGCDKFGVGVCNIGAVLSCVDGEITCTFDAVPSFEIIEVSCDNLDNDCDGETDEGMVNISNPVESTCKLDGVCEAGGVKGTCSNGEWICTYNTVDNYEDNETQCDGEDNDCDGLVDENLSDASASTCSLEGVCAEGTQVACLNGNWICDYTNVADYSGDLEYFCDGLDNNCDGFPDEGMCDVTEPCFDDTQCLDGKCRPGPGTTDSFCTTGVQCVLPGEEGGSVVLVAPGEIACANTVSTVTCVNTLWTSQLTCPEDSPTCLGGLCVKCVPGELNCTDPDTRVICNNIGTEFEQAPSCPSAKMCVGAGVCVEDDEILCNALIDDLILERPSLAPLLSGEFIVGWDNLSGTDGDQKGVYVREISAQGQGVGAETTIAQAFEGDQDGLFVIPVNDRVLAIWSTTTSTSFPSIIGRYMDEVGFIENEFLISESLFKNHTNPWAVQLANGDIAVAWESISPNGGTTSINARLLDDTGAPVTSEFTVSSSTTGDQFRPCLAGLPDSRFVVVWESGSSNGFDIALQRYKPDGSKQGGKIIVNEVLNGVQGNPSVDVLSNADIVVAYESTAQGTSDTDVYIRVFNSAGFPEGSSFLAHYNSGGVQSSPNLAHVGTLGYSIAYVEDSTETTEADIFIQSFDLEHEIVGDRQMVNLTVDGLQGEPMVKGLDDGQVICVWSNATSETETDIYLRFFDFEY